ncbi:aromatic ring-opening dioxygenase [Schizosaccharomyces japonicus yFS275]|uniref:Aromatic ring-opening dioxygenase n=1 Tax=Schizosaccharomyces japonicus (strain yFS275 / FY16936) TaxID=402676 RepID=B6K3N5_SCHJY|nr:aromatic ring-opening dioxygenase [Schizosaccharomyces japonicus yFS275]EEB08092.2 aromatic ring-opening dioxygenase [Schizosaccharomyces japonicus yFS275]
MIAAPFLLLKDDGIDMVGREFQKDGEHYMFLQKLGPFLLERFRPKAIIVFSAHYETRNLVHVFSRDAPNKLFYDYYGFPKWMFDLSFPSKGSSKVAQQVLNCLESNNISAAAVSGDRGLDHGVFVPFSIMFPTGLSIPVVEISMPSLDPFKLIAIGAALDDLRKDYLIVSGGLSIHTFEDPTAFNREFAADGFKQFHSDLLDAISIQDTDRRNRQLHAMMMHPFFRAAHPREEHFVPLFIPAGARGRTQVLCDLYGAVTALFGLNA